MKATENQTTSPNLQGKGGPFFQKGNGRSFFSQHESNRSRFFFNKHLIQTKLTIGKPNDKYEQEADAMADKVIQQLVMPKVQENPLGTTVTPLIQPKCTACEQDEKVQKKEEGEDELRRISIFERPPTGNEESLQRKCGNCEKEEKLQLKSTTSHSSISPAIENGLKASKGNGSKIPSPIKEQMEHSFGSDFSDVRLHNDTAAVTLNKRLHSQAFAHDRDIYFNAGKYDTNSVNGKQLMAHELTHVVQQGKAKNSQGVGAPSIQKLGDLTQAPPAMSCTVANSSPGAGTDILFGTNSSAISRPQQSLLNGFVRGWHAGGGTTNIRIDGYASTDGPDPLNWRLSCSRADVVRSALENPSDGSPGISPGFIQSFAQGETNEFGNNLAANRKVIISSFARPVPPPTFRTVTTDFGTYDVYPNTFVGPLLPNQLREADFQRLQNAWNNMVANTGGMVTNGTDGDRLSLRNIFGREIPRSMTFRNLFLAIVEDPAHPVIINVGRNNANRVDQFNNNSLDLNDLGLYEESPRAGYEWAQTQGEILIHVLSERRFAALNGRANFGPAHQHPLGPGGDQENYRRDLGQPGRVVSQVRNNLPNGLQEAVATDTNGNILRWRLDPSGGDPVAFEIVYEPVAGAPVAAHHTRTNSMRAQVNSSGAAAENLYVQFSAAGRTANTAPLGVNAGSSQIFNAALRNLVPAGATIQVRLFRRNAVGADTQIALLNWAHPFNNANVQVNVGGNIYNLNVSLNMSN